MVDPHHAALVLEQRHHPFPVKRNNRLPGSSSQPSQTNEAAPEPPPSSANNNNSNSNSANHLHTTDEPAGNAADKLEDRTVWVGDLHKLSAGGDAVLIPLISKYLRRFGSLDKAKPVKVRTATGGQGSLGYAFVVFEHARSAEAALRNAVMPGAKLKVEPHKESKYMHDVSWKQGEAEPAAAATTTPAAAAASVVTTRQPPVHISPPAPPPEAPPPPAQFNTAAPPFASNRAASTTVFATSRSTPTERAPQARPAAHTARVISSGTCSAHSAPPLHMHMHMHMHMHVHMHTHCMPPRAAVHHDGADPGGQGPHQAAPHRRADWAGEPRQVRRLPLVRAVARGGREGCSVPPCLPRTAALWPRRKGL